MRQEFNRLSEVTVLLLLGCGLVMSAEENPALESYYEWQIEAFAINAPLGGLVGNPENGRKIAIARKKGNCIACHVMPIPEV